MSNLINFDFQSQTVRVELKNGEPLFCLTDVATILDISNANPSRFNLDEAGVHKMYISYESGKKQVTFISEPNLYRVIFRSNKAEAVKFQNWVFDEVLPSIRKTGGYSQKSTATDRTPLRQAVTALVAKYGLMHDEGYRLVHQYMGVSSIDEIAIEDLPEAVAYVHRLMLGTINDRELYDVLVSCAIHLKQFGTMLSSLHAHGYYADDDNPIDPATRCYNYLVRVVDKMNLRNIHGVPMFANNKINFYNGFSRPI